MRTALAESHRNELALVQAQMAARDLAVREARAEAAAALDKAARADADAARAVAEQQRTEEALKEHMQMAEANRQQQAADAAQLHQLQQVCSVT